MQTRFRGRKHLKAWLLQSPEGQSIIEEILEEMGPGRQILAVQCHDAVEIYGPPMINVAAATKVTGRTTTAEAMTEELLGMQLTPVYRRLYEPRNLRKIVQPRCITVMEYEAWRAFNANMEMLDGVSS